MHMLTFSPCTAFKFFLQFTVYATAVCGLTIGICGYALWRRKHLGYGSDARIIVALALAAFLGIFACAMAMTCTHFVLTNVTTVESQQLKSRSKMLAVRIQRGSPPVEGQYDVVTYPLPKDGSPPPHVPLQQDAAPLANGTADDDTAEPDPFKIAREARAARRAARDLLAFRTFAIVSVNTGVNVWDLGWRGNWESVMGSSVFDWIMPFRLSPCCNHESTVSFYELSAEFKQICADLKLPPCRDLEDARQW